jgi:hypothetical protein
MCPLRAVHLNQPNCGTLLHSGHVRRGGCLPDISSSYVGEDVVGILGYNVGILLSRNQRFGETYCLPTLSMEAIYSFETLVSIFKSTLHYNPEDQHEDRLLKVLWSQWIHKVFCHRRSVPQTSQTSAQRWGNT